MRTLLALFVVLRAAAGDNCDSFCNDEAHSWGLKCTWSLHCGGCPKCAPSHRAGACPDCIAVFYPGLDDAACYRVPTAIKTTQGTILAFAEKRIFSCGDDGAIHLVLRRSEDNGVTWGPLITVREGIPPCVDCPAAISNANPLEVTLQDGSNALLLHYDTLNNPSPERHGLDMQTWSLDDGLTWNNHTLLVYPPQENTGAMVGPSIGIQGASGRIYFSAHLAYSYWAGAGWDGSRSNVAFLYWSDDYGKSWASSEMISGLDECSIAFLVDATDERIMMNCRVGKDELRTQLVWTPVREENGAVSMVHTQPQQHPALVDPGCQGSIINVGGVLYQSNANHETSRKNMSIRRSTDLGNHWSPAIQVWSGPSAYSQLIDLHEDGWLGVLFEAGTLHGPYETISFVRVEILPAPPPVPPAPFLPPAPPPPNVPPPSPPSSPMPPTPPPSPGPPARPPPCPPSPLLPAPSPPLLPLPSPPPLESALPDPSPLPGALAAPPPSIPELAFSTIHELTQLAFAAVAISAIFALVVAMMGIGCVCKHWRGQDRTRRSAREEKHAQDALLHPATRVARQTSSESSMQGTQLSASNLDTYRM